MTISAMGVMLGGYLWQFLSTNQDFTGSLNVGLPLGLLLVVAVGPGIAWLVEALSALALSWLSGGSFGRCLRQDAPSLLPLALLGLSPLLGFAGFHTPAYNAGVIILVSLSVGGCLAFKAAIAWSAVQAGPRPRRLDDRVARRILIALVVVLAVLFSGLQVLRYDAYQLWGVDHSRVAQGLWNTLHGRFLTFTFVGGTQLNLLSDHFELIYLLLAPLYWIWPDPRLLFVVQVVALSLGAWPVYRLALRRLKSPSLALAWAGVYLTLPMVVAAAQDSAGAIRPDTLAIPIFLFMLDALGREKWLGFAVTVVLSFIAKQYLSLLVGMLGLYMAVRQRRLRGLAISALGFAWFVIVVQWIMPAIHRGPNLTLAAQFGSTVGESGLPGMVVSLLRDPSQFLGRAFTLNQLAYLFFFGFTFAGLPLFDPLLAAAGLPVLAIFALALPFQTVNMGNHHYFPVVPFFLVASINGLAALARRVRLGVRAEPRRVLAAGTGLALGLSVMGGFFWTDGPWSWSFWNPRSQTTFFANRYAVGAHSRAVDGVIERVPSGEPVLASDYALAHLANRPQVFHFFAPPDDVLERVDYAVADLTENHVRTVESTARERGLLDKLLTGSDFGLTAYDDGVLLFERGAQDAYSSRVELLSGVPRPAVALGVDLGQRLRLLGYDPPAGPLAAGEPCRVTYYWQVLDGFAAPFEVKLGVNPQSVETHQTDYVVIDRLAGASGEFSVLHLPTAIQLPAGNWKPGQIIEETFDFRVPPDASGEYAWSVGLYAVPRFLGIRAEPERQVPGALPQSLGLVAVSR